MKKRLTVIMLVVLMILSAASVTAFAATSGDYQYTDNGDGTCTITQYLGSATDIMIPGTLGGLTVTAIGDYAFESFDYNKSDICSISIPQSVTKIGDYAFYWNTITSLVIPDDVTSIGIEAFKHNRISSLSLPAGLQNINRSAFAHNLLTSLTIPDSVTLIGNYAFMYNRLTSVTFGNSMKTIGHHAFYANDIIRLDLPWSLRYIGAYAFTYNHFSEFELPVDTGVWEDGTGNTFTGGDTVSNFGTDYECMVTKPVVSINSSAQIVNNDGEPHEISFTLDQTGDTSVRITDAIKKTIRNIRYKEAFNSGTFTEYWNGKDSSGQGSAFGKLLHMCDQYQLGRHDGLSV